MEGKQIYDREQRSESVHSKNTIEPYKPVAEHSKRTQTKFLAPRSLCSPPSKFSIQGLCSLKGSLPCFIACSIQHTIGRQLPILLLNGWSTRSGGPLPLSIADCIGVGLLTCRTPLYAMETHLQFKW